MNKYEFNDKKFERLTTVLLDAFDQAANGKGRERHGNGLDWESQPISVISKITGLRGPEFQVMKKTAEAVGMYEKNEPIGAYRELLGAIIYVAQMAILVADKFGEKNK